MPTKKNRHRENWFAERSHFAVHVLQVGGSERRESCVVRLKTNQQVQISCGQTLVPQSRQSRRNVTFAVSELCRRMSDPSQHSHEFRSHSFLGLRLGWRQRNERGNHLLKRFQEKQKIRSRTVCSGIGSVRSDGGSEHDV